MGGLIEAAIKCPGPPELGASPDDARGGRLAPRKGNESAHDGPPAGAATAAAKGPAGCGPPTGRKVGCDPLLRRAGQPRVASMKIGG